VEAPRLQARLVTDVWVCDHVLLVGHADAPRLHSETDGRVWLIDALQETLLEWRLLQ